MNRLFDFIRKIYIFLIFIVLEFTAFSFYRDNSIYVRGEMHNVSNNLLGDVYLRITNFKEYFSLKSTNNELKNQNADLMSRLSAMENLNIRLLRGDILDTLPSKDSSLAIINDTLESVTLLSDSDSSSVTVVAPTIKKDKYIPARVLNNNLSGQQNHITLDRGWVDSVRVNLPVVCGDAIVGYIVAVNKNLSVAISVLNVDFKTSGTLKKDGSLCSVFWKGESYEYADFSGISRYSDINEGDTILTTGFSSFFTEGKIIGTIKDFTLIDGMYYSGRINLTTKFNRLKDVQIIFPDNIEERLELENHIHNNK